MKAKKEANWYDKVFKENLDAITLSLGVKGKGGKNLHRNLHKLLY